MSAKTRPWRSIAVALLVAMGHIVSPGAGPAAAAGDNLDAVLARSNAYITEVLGHERSGTKHRLTLKPGLHVVVVPYGATSRKTGRNCEGCTDPCREFSLHVIVGDIGRIERITEYAGKRCLSANSRKWTAVRALQRIRFRQSKPKGPDVEMVRRAQRGLGELGYYFGPTDGALTSTFSTSLTIFRADMNLPTTRHTLTAREVELIEATVRLNQGDACPNARSRFCVCGSLE